MGLPVYVISLRTSEGRRRNMTERLGALGIPFQFVDAIDGRTERLPDVFDGARIVRDRFYGESSLACSLSHRHVHRMMLDRGDDVALVLEDDALFAPDFSVMLSEANKFDFDVLKLEGGRHHYRHVCVSQRCQYSVEVGIIPSHGAAAYLVTRAGARKFCQLPVIDTAVDVLFGDPRLNLRVLELWPFAAFQDRESETLGGYNPYQGGTEPRHSFMSQFMASVVIRSRIARAHGIGMVAALELTRFFKH